MGPGSVAVPAKGSKPSVRRRSRREGPRRVMLSIYTKEGRSHLRGSALLEVRNQRSIFKLQAKLNRARLIALCSGLPEGCASAEICVWIAKDDAIGDVSPLRFKAHAVALGEC